jgi:dinuclear metal center YbgI/SA1388 family protein
VHGSQSDSEEIMISLQAFCAYCEELLKSSQIPDSCPNGLQVEGSSNVKKMAAAVSASLETIEAAVASGVDLLLVHHGIFWDRDSRRVVGTLQRKLKLLLENNISLAAYHLPLDCHQGLGNNWKAARDLGWQGLEPFGNHNGMLIGVKGTFTEEMSIAQFLAQLESYYQHPVHKALGGKERVKTAALVSGGAYKFISEAAASGIDCFITGNFDEPAWHTAYEEKIHFLALGHSATERIGPMALGSHLAEQFDLAYEFIDTPNPF